MSELKVLVFPLDMDKAIDFISHTKSLNVEVVGASSIMNSAKGINVDAFQRLPFITDSHFESSFLNLISRYSVTHVYTPHGGVWTHLAHLKNIDSTTFSFSLCEPSPYVADWMQLQPSYDWAEVILKENFVETLDISSDVNKRERLKLGQYASLHKQFTTITGQCDELKLLALAHIARLVPEGDLVEIGSFSGRSAFAIGWLAHEYEIGNLISVDPWCNDKLEGQGEQADILNKRQDEGRDVIDFEKIFWSYIGAVSLLDNVGYIRDISEKAVHEYVEASALGELSSPELGTLALNGKIAMLHIDGNHRYDYVCKDIEVWEPLVMPGGWVLLDDYVWAFGDGPQRAGDELLLTGKFDIAFSMSDTLFLRKLL